MSSDPRALVRLVLALVLLVVPAWCLLEALELVLTLSGESPTAAEEREAARWVRAAVVVAVAASLLGLALSTGRRGAVWGFGVALGLSCVLAAVAVLSMRPYVPEPAPARGHVCQERSGGGTTCPGG